MSHVIEQSYVLDAAPCAPSSDALSPNAAGLPYVNLLKLRTQAIRQALVMTRGHKGQAAKLLGVHPNTLSRFKLDTPEAAADEGLVDDRTAGADLAT